MSSNNHKAVVARIRTSKHPNADRLQCGVVSNFNVVVGLDVQDNELGLYFPTDLALSVDYCKANDLYRRKDAAGNNAGGMFEDNGRVRTQKFRGSESDGYFARLDSLEFTGGDVTSLREGDFVDEFNGVKLCEKYYSKKTQSGIANAIKTRKKGETEYFKKYGDTEQLRFYYDKIPVGSLCIITDKLHGTSFRLGNVPVARELTWKDKVAKFFGVQVQEEKYEILNGTRNVILDGKDTGFYSEEFRWRSVAPLIDKIPKGCVVYGEVVGFSGVDQPIMSSVSTDKLPEIKKKYGPTMTYTYGCSRTSGECDIYIYKITYPTPDGKQVDLCWEDLKHQCNEWGIKYVPELCKPFIYDGNVEGLIKLCDELCDGPDIIDGSHLREGLCLRLDGNHPKVFKNKNYNFKVLEGIIKDANALDIEEAS